MSRRPPPTTSTSSQPRLGLCNSLIRLTETSNLLVPLSPSMIDLNDALPSSSASSESPFLDAFSVVRSFHDNLTPPNGGPAELPRDLLDCAGCGSLVVQGDVVVCDGCELGFHLDCAEMRKEVVLDKWMCGKCVRNAVPCSGWPLGVKTKGKVKKRGPSDINALPSSDGEGEDLAVSRKSARLTVANGVAEEKENLRDFVGESVSCVKLTDFVPVETGGSESSKLNNELPAQYEDFFVLSVGKIDARPSYHIANQIWPIGYRSCWHDKITGSLFTCDVLDGGDSGPVFKVKRFPCSALPIPVGSTILYKPNISQPDSQNEGNSDDMTNMNTDYDEDFNVLMMLLDPSPPKEQDMLSCLGCTSDECPGNIPSDNLVLVDEIGEFSVEESSSSSAWKRVSEKFIDACRKVYMQTGTLRLFCRHAAHATGSFNWDSTEEKVEEKVAPLTKFCGSFELINIPSVIQDHRALETSSEILLKWLDQDRFGLDVEFVQEVLERLSGAIDCPYYVCLKEREAYGSSLTVGNGSLLAKMKDGFDDTYAKSVDDSFEGCQGGNIQKVKHPLIDKHFTTPPGKRITSRLPPQLLGDALQVWEFLCRFHDVLELNEPVSFEELEKELLSPWFDGSDLANFQRGPQDNMVLTSNTTDAVSGEDPLVFIPMETGAMKEAAQAKLASATYSRCNGFTLTKIHKSLLRVLISELQSKVTAIIDPNFDSRESKSKRGRRKDTDCWIASIRSKINILPLNELTWPELVRRYILSVLSMDGRLDSADIATCESGKVFRCLQGDGGVLCGSLTGVAGIEADTLFLAEAMQSIFGSLNIEHDTLAIDDVESEEYFSESVVVEDVDPPEWAKVLEPVRKLPTNVGARIKKCIFEALDKGPPEWAKKVLEHSVSKEVYKGNASGPTKKAVVSVLEDLRTQGLQQKPVIRKQQKKRLLSISDVVMKRCRLVLRLAAAADDAKIFCNLLGRKFINCNEGDDGGLLGSPDMVSRPLDFRTIDLKLAAGAYGGSHEAFLEDVREFWTNVRSAYKDQPDLIKLAETLSRNFEALYESKVLAQFQELVEYSKSECLSAELKEEIDGILASACEIPKAPWEEGVCKVCGIDRDDDNVLLCDKCDAEYHKYCLNPPLARIPEGNWYCPSCVTGKHVVQEASNTRSNFLHGKKFHGEFTHAYLDSLAQVAALMEEREYWELDVFERSYLLKFLCDESLNSALVRRHVEQCAEAPNELLQKFRSLSVDLKALKLKEENLAAEATKVDKCFKAVEDDDTKERNACNIENHVECENLIMPSSENQQGLCAPLVIGSTRVGANDPSIDVNNSQSNNIELNLVRNEILHLKHSIASIESQLLKLSVRREFLGSDSFGRLYWVLAEPGTHPSVISTKNVGPHKSGKIVSLGYPAASVTDDSIPCLYERGDDNVCCMWVYCQTDAEIKQLVDCLQDSNPNEKELKDSILHWEKLRFKGSEQSASHHCEDSDMALSTSRQGEHFASLSCLNTIAAALLETKHGPCLESEPSDFLKRQFRKAKGLVEEQMYRCQCLEPVWPSRHHCLSCHRTFFSIVELNGHNDGKCNISPPVPEKSRENNNDTSKGKGTIKSEVGQIGPKDEADTVDASRSGLKFIRHLNDESVCPFDYEDICSKFVIKDSIKDVVKEIGLIGSNGIPSFVPSISPYVSDSTLMLVPSQETLTIQGDIPKTDEQLALSQKIAGQDGKFSDNSSQPAVEHKDEKSPSHCNAPLCVGNCCFIPRPSFRPLMGKDAYNILQQLKINLLDMDAALPEDALRQSKMKLERRWAWHAFVKSAERIYEMVQATIAFEDMIKSEYMKKSWWYWSSLSAAAKISTLSSLALRIYSLDAAIDYSKTSCLDALQPTRKQYQKQQVSSSDISEKCKLNKKPNKKRKERES